MKENILFLGTLNIGLHVGAGEPARQAPKTLEHLNLFAKGNYSFKFADDSQYDGQTERCIVVRAALMPNEIKLLCCALQQECIAVKYDDPDLGAELVWHPDIKPKFGFDNDYFINW